MASSGAGTLHSGSEPRIAVRTLAQVRQQGIMGLQKDRRSEVSALCIVQCLGYLHQRVDPGSDNLAFMGLPRPQVACCNACASSEAQLRPLPPSLQ